MDSEIKNLRIIIAIPSLLQQLFVVQSLKKMGVDQVYPCDNLKQARQVLNANSIDVVISSLYFDAETSYPLLQKITEENDRKTLFLLVTAECKQEILEPFRQHGVFAILKKPYKDNDLYIALLDAVYLNRALVIDSSAFSGKILLVDDSLMARCFVKRLLIKWAIAEGDIIEADNGHEAMKLMKNQDISLVVSDFNMPVMNGLELLGAIRKMPNYRYFPVIMITSERDSEKLAALRALDVHCILDKPFSIIELFHQIRFLSILGVAPSHQEPMQSTENSLF